MGTVEAGAHDLFVVMVIGEGQYGDAGGTKEQASQSWRSKLIES